MVKIVAGGLLRDIPQFTRCTDRAKFCRLHNERAQLNKCLAAMHRQGCVHADDFGDIDFARVLNFSEQLSK